MLTMTDTAAEAVKTITARATPEDGAGLRISDSEAESGFELSIVGAPEATDTIVVTEGARVFLDATAAAALDDKILDADVAADGAVRFGLADVN